MLPFSDIEISRVFQMECSTGFATCFLATTSQRSYFVTAAHVMRGIQPGDQIFLRMQNGRTKLEIAEVQMCSAGVDAAVFSTRDFFVGGEDPLEARGRAEGVLLGGQVHFLGFPHGLVNTLPGHLGFSTPLVRTAYFSGIVNIQGVPTMILDGFNNPGYSGSPVFVSDGRIRSIFGVISGYRYEKASHSAVYQRTGDEEKEIPNTYVKANSGMIYAYGRKYYEEAAEKLSQFNPLLSAEQLEEAKRRASPSQAS